PVSGTDHAGWQRTEPVRPECSQPGSRHLSTSRPGYSQRPPPRRRTGPVPACSTIRPVLNGGADTDHPLMESIRVSLEYSRRPFGYLYRRLGWCCSRTPLLRVRTAKAGARSVSIPFLFARDYSCQSRWLVVISLLTGPGEKRKACQRA